MESVVDARGRVTIPRAMREHLGLKPGDRIALFVRCDGSVVLLPKRPVSKLRGIIKARRKPVSIDEMAEAAAAGACEDWPSSQRR